MERLDGHLEHALAAIEANTLEPALGALLSAWRTCKHERIAALVEDVSTRISSTRKRPSGKRVKDKQQAWLALADHDDPADLGVLLATLVDVKAAEPLGERVARLAQRDADPRIAAALVKWVEYPPIPGATAIEPLRAALAVIVEIADPRQLGELQRIVAASDGDGGSARLYLNDHAEAVLAQLADATSHVELAATPLAVIGRIETQLAASRVVLRGSAAELFAAVYANPADDAPRAILADYLQECGDPRGEFIALQLARARGGPRSKREGELLRASGRDWLGAIEPVVLKSKLAFERGFVARCAIKNESRAILDRLAARPEWATVTDVDVSAMHLYSRQFVEKMPMLRALRGTQVGHLPSEHATLEEIEMASLSAGGVAMLAATTGLTALRRLGVEFFFGTVAECEPLWESPIGRQLDSFRCDFWEIEPWIRRVLDLPIHEIAISRRQHDPWGFRLSNTTGSFEFVWSFTKPKGDDFERLYPLISRLPDHPRLRELHIVSSGVPVPPSITELLARFNSR